MKKIGDSLIFVLKGKYKFINESGNKIEVKELKEDIDLLSLIVIYNRLIDICNVLNKCFNVCVTGFTLMAIFDLVSTIIEMIRYQERVVLLLPWIVFVIVVEYSTLFSCELVTSEVSIIVLN